MSQRRVGKICNIQRASRSARFRAVFEHTRPASLHICPDQKFFPTSLCGVLVFGSVSRRPPVRPPARPSARPSAFHTQLAHTQLVHTHNLLTHNLSTHNLLTHNLLTHNLSCPHTTCHHTTCSLTHILSSHNLQLAHAQLVHTQLAHTQLVLTQLGRRGTWRHPPSLCVAGVVLGDIHLHFAWQAWHLRHWAGSGGAPGRRGSLSGGRGTW